MLHLTLADGRAVDASAGHPTVTGQKIGDLNAGDLLDGSRLRTVEQELYAGDTWDLLPAGPSGAYWANDVLLGSVELKERLRGDALLEFSPLFTIRRI
jgi:hypothetical protein